MKDPLKIVLTDFVGNLQCEYPDPDFAHRCPAKATVKYRMGGGVFHYCTRHTNAHLGWEDDADSVIDDQRSKK